MSVYRFTLSRAAGWRKPADGIACGRPGPWGNPYLVGQPPPDSVAIEPIDHKVRLDYASAVAMFEADLLAGPKVGLVTYDVAHLVEHLAGRPLGCWCPPAARCHTEVLARHANNMAPTWRPPHRSPPWN